MLVFGGTSVERKNQNDINVIIHVFERIALKSALNRCEHERIHSQGNEKAAGRTAATAQSFQAK